MKDELIKVINCRDNHIKYRCSIIFVMCSLSTYNWLCDSLFKQFENEFYSVYYQNCLIFVIYIIWDIYKMTFSTDRQILYRTDLMTHHIVALVSYVNLMNYVPLLGSYILIGEYLSLMNYVWKDKNHLKLLSYYRFFCICFIRLPVWCFFLFYYNPYHLIFYVSPQDYNFVKTITFYSYLFGIGYDLVVFKKLYFNLQRFSQKFVEE